MAIAQLPALRPVRMGNLGAEMRIGANGERYVRNPGVLPPHPRSMTDHLRRWAKETPERILFADRAPDGGWRSVTYGEALERARSLAQVFVDCGLSVARPIAILSGNGVEHALIVLGAMMAGVPVAPVSPAYSLVSIDFAKLRHVFGLVTPGLLFAADGAPFTEAIRAVATPDMRLMVGRNAPDGLAVLDYAQAAATPATEAVEAADAAVTPDTIAKFLFTSGSTGMPKAVINTQRMLTTNQAMILNAYAFLADRPPVLVDWLPWNHTAGGNHNFGIALSNGGSLYIDDGAPTPNGIDNTVRNLTEIAPTLYFNVPKGYEMLTARMAGNATLRDSFFSQLEMMQYAGAGLSQHVWDTLERLAVEATGRKVMMVTGYGSTETAPFACTVTWPVSRPGEIGLPAPELEMKLLPSGEKLELRLKGPTITPGYWRQPEKTAESFDEDGFYKIGDALKFIDENDVSKGFLFDGRVSEDFKLSTGTWVNFASVRGALVRGFAPYVRDAVLTGLDRDFIGALLFVDVDACRVAAVDLAGASEREIAHHKQIRATFQ
ncbi:MAG TPA: feruloyl-CoA synthase, partial [Rhizobiaceae bacterium]|nr:feruloyl-CoA synthase [Rhizobiaceae bacterium]